MEKLVELGVRKTGPNIRNKLARVQFNRGVFGPMLGGSRHSIIAIVGLVCSIVFWLPDEAVAQSLNSQGVSQETPVVESQGAGKVSQSQQGPGNFSIPVRIIENPSDAKHTREREKKSDEHDAADLKAQQDAARAAVSSAVTNESQLSLAWLQFWLSIFGTGFLFLALILNWLAVKCAQVSAEQARAAVKVAERSSQIGMRAYISLKNVECQWTADKKTEKILSWDFIPVWNNSGQTPTVSAVSMINFAFVDGDVDVPALLEYADQGVPGRSFNPPAAIMHGDSIKIEIEQAIRMRAGASRAFVWGWIDYNDVFPDTERHRTEFCFEIKVTGNPIYKNGGFAYPRHGKFNGHDSECYRKPGQAPS